MSPDYSATTGMQETRQRDKDSEAVGGYCNRLLRVDLSSGRCVVTPLAEESMLRKYIGGVGLGMRLLLDEIRPGMSATDPDSPLIILAGPLTGTSAPSSSNVTVVALNHNSPGGAAAGCAGGHWAANLKHAGYDGLIVTGRAREPVFLLIEDERLAIRDASAFWGLDTRDTERLIKRALYDHSSFSVACIGPAGEAMLPGASIRNDRNHGVHLGGVGAVMGSKLLKAIAVSGSRPVPLKNPIQFDDVTREWSRSIATESNFYGAAANRASSLLRQVPECESQAFTGKLSTDETSSASFRERLVSTAENSWTVVPKACFNCETVCAYDCHVNQGDFARTSASICGYYENVADPERILSISDPSAALALIDHFHAAGIDPELVSTVMARGIQLFESGAVSSDETNGLELTLGSVDASMELLDQIVDGYGFGGQVLRKSLTELARTTYVAADLATDRDYSDLAPHGDVANEGVNSGRDQLNSDVVQLQQRRGDWSIAPDLAHVNQLMSRDDSRTEIQPVLRPHSQQLWANSLGVCLSACEYDAGAMSFSSRALIQATGWEGLNVAEATLLEERVARLRRRIAIKCAGEKGGRPPFGRIISSSV